MSEQLVLCKDCIFFTAEVPVGRDLSVGNCQRYPPKGKLRDFNQPRFPSTLSSSSCGEGRRRAK